MVDTPSSEREARAFRALERALTRRRLRAIDVGLALEVGAIALLLAATLFWQTRVPLDGWARRGGPAAVAGVASVLFAIVALAAAATTAIGLRRSLAGPREGPDWLALPLEPAAIRRHLEWRARAALPFFLLAQLAIAMALWGLVPIAGLIALAAAAFALTALATGSGAALAMRLALPRAGEDEVRLAISLARSGRAGARKRRGVRWQKRAPLRAIMLQDARLTAREPRALARAIAAATLAAAAALVWLAPWPPPLQRPISFGLALLAAAEAGESVIEMTSLHPFAALRVLPVGVGAFWGARFALAAGVCTLLVASQASAAWLMPPAALEVHLVWTGAAALAITSFGANLAVTLYPRADHARRVLALSLALAATASYILPLAGWVLLLTGWIHSARRLPPWTRGELLSCS